jgi:thioredoxin 1
MGVFSGLLFSMMLVLNSGCSASQKEKTEPGTNNITEKSNEIKYATDMSTFNELISGIQPVLVDFYADWCAPCRTMAPILEQVSGDMHGKVKIVKVNVDKNRDAAMKYKIQSIPTLMLFQNGEIKWQGVGVFQADQIKQIVLSKTN